MFDDIPFIILREMFIRLYREDLFNFKLITKRVLNFIENDRVCQCVYLQKRFNLSFNDNLKELIKILDSKKYSRFFIQEKLSFKMGEFSIFIRPYDDAMTTIHINDTFHIVRSNVDFVNQQNFKLLEEKYSLFEDKIINEGFILINPKFYDEESLEENLINLNRTFWKTKTKIVKFCTYSSINSKICIEFLNHKYYKKRFRIILNELFKKN